MVAIKYKPPYLPDGTLDKVSWLREITEKYHLPETELIEKILNFTEKTTVGLTTFYGQPCIEQSLEMSDLMLSLLADQEAAAAAMLITTVQHCSISIEVIKTEGGDTIAKLVAGVLQMNVINSLANVKSRQQIQIDRLRKTLLAMVADIRVVLIKLVERTALMRGIKNINPIERKRIAEETMDLYAPLANRLGIGQLKWELEDLAFHYIDPDTYKNIAKFINDRRTNREALIQQVIVKLRQELSKEGINADLSGRAKHIYSVFLKMKRKHLPPNQIYDYTAIRILVPTIADCYQALSIAHQLWEHIPDEFDDYISNPKPNGYRSIHTAVIGPEQKNMEIQIRTFEMHNEAEHGFAAHWIYKENKQSVVGYEAKITFLRQLLAWQKEVAEEGSELKTLNQEFLEDKVYVFTPKGDILDLPNNATPLDFAYQIHTELGHRCRGAKVNGHIVPLSYILKTGDQVELITTKTGAPSRDWLSKETGYLGTARARSKVAQWFRQQELTQYIENGRHLLEREFDRLNIHPNMQKLATHFQFKDDDALYAAVGHGTIKASQVLHVAQIDTHQKEISTPLLPKKIPIRGSPIAGTNNLLTRIAKCCKPIPGEQVIGYITQGRGVSIHRKNCQNIAHLPLDKTHRFMDVSWDSKQLGSFFAELQIRAYAPEELLREITSLLTTLKIDLINLNSAINKKDNIITVSLMIQIQNLEQLNQFMTQLKHIPTVLDIKRMNK